MNEYKYRIQVRYRECDFSPEVAEFVKNQNNMSLTIRLLINDAISRFGTGDLVTSTLSTLQPSLNSNTDSTTEPMKNLLIQSNTIESDNSVDKKKKKATTPLPRKKVKKKEEAINNEPKSNSDILPDTSKNENINSDDENTPERVDSKAIDTDNDNNDENIVEKNDYSIPDANFDPSIYG